MMRWGGISTANESSHHLRVKLLDSLMPSSLKNSPASYRSLVRIGFLIAASAILFGAMYLQTIATVGQMNAPPGATHDDMFFDNLALNLSEGKGFMFDFHRKDYRQRFLSQNEQGQHNWLRKYRVKGRTSSRAVGYPATLAVLYKVFGWRWDVARWFNIIVMTIGLTALIAYALKRFGYLAASITLLVLILDFSIFSTVPHLATEPLGIVLVCFSFIAMDFAIRGKRVWPFAVAGFCFGLLLLVRSNYAPWLPMMLLIFLGVLFRQRHDFSKRKLIFKQTLAYFGVLVLLCAPWWARNCLVTKHFNPLGCEGKIALCGAYCDESYADRANWQPAVVSALKIELGKNPRFDDMDKAETEHYVGMESSNRAMTWVRNNPAKLPNLLLMRVVGHWSFYEPFPWWLHAANAYLLALAILGAILCRKEQGKLLLLILAMDTLVVMMTWPHHGRYTIPIRPLIAMFFAYAVASILRAIYSRWMRKRAAAPSVATASDETA